MRCNRCIEAMAVKGAAKCVSVLKITRYAFERS
jgi:hypothetical protein